MSRSSRSLLQHFSTTSITIESVRLSEKPREMLRVHGVSLPSKLEILIVTPPQSSFNLSLANSYFDYAFVAVQCITPSCRFPLAFSS